MRVVLRERWNRRSYWTGSVVAESETIGDTLQQQEAAAQPEGFYQRSSRAEYHLGEQLSFCTGGDWLYGASLVKAIACDSVITLIVSFKISVTERTLNKTSIVERMASFNRTLSHIFHGIPDGASYDIKVSTSVSDAQPAQMLVFAPPLPMPTQLKVFPEKNGSYVVAWRENLEFKQEP